MAVPPLHLSGPVLVAPDDVRDEAWLLDGRITFEPPVHGARSHSDTHSSTHARDIETVAGWVIPGLVDAHCHVGLDVHGAVDDEESERQALADRAAGTLLLRDAGSPADTRWVDDREDLPRLVRAGRHLARPRRYIRNFAHEIEPEDLAAYVAVEAQRGDGWVKLVGDWIDRDVGDLAPCWPRAALEDAIAAAHQHGARVTAHCFGEDSITDLVEAGIDCIEHGTGLTPDTIALLAERGVAIVPTLVNIASFPAIADAGQERFPAYAAHMRDLHRRRYATIAAAHEAGIQIHVGTDAGGSLTHGLVAAEVSELVTCGLTPLEALDAACWSSRRWLGRPGLEEGESADLVVYAADPRTDHGVLAHPQTVVLRGRVY
jgi:imidazolonepropionase-like amidohydrolase